MLEGLTTTKPKEGKIPNINHWNNDSCREYIERNVLPVIWMAKRDRMLLEKEWEQIRRVVLLKHDENQKYKGRSNVYIPEYSKARDTLISFITKGLFPSDEYLDVKERTEKGLEEARNIKNFLQYQFENQMHLRTNIKGFIGQYVDYGIGVSKVWWENGEGLKTIKRGKVGELQNNNNNNNNYKTGARFATRNIFYWFVWPTNINSLDDAQLVFEEIDVPQQQLKMLGDNGVYGNVDYLIKFGNQTDMLHENIHLQQQYEVQKSTGLQTKTHSSVLANQFTLKECWLDMPLPDDCYLSGEVKGTPVPTKITLCGNIILEVRRNPFLHQKKPYLILRSKTFEGSFYSKGAGYMAKELQYQLNDFSNQISDAGAYALNPFAKIIPTMLAGPLPELEPGAVFNVQSMDAIQFDRPPIEQLNYGPTYTDRIAAKLNDVAGAPPVLQGQNAGKGARTATATTTLNKNASNPLQVIVEDIENDVMIEAMEMVFALANQFQKEKLTAIVGETIFSIAPDDLCGEYIFRYLASSQSANQQQRAQQSLTLLQLLPNVTQLLQANGKIVDPTPLLRRIYSDGFGYRNFNEFVKDAQAQSMQAQSAQGSMPQNGQPMASSAETGNGGTPPNLDDNLNENPNDYTSNQEPVFD